MPCAQTQSKPEPVSSSPAEADDVRTQGCTAHNRPAAVPGHREVCLLTPHPEIISRLRPTPMQGVQTQSITEPVSSFPAMTDDVHITGCTARKHREICPVTSHSEIVSGLRPTPMKSAQTQSKTEPVLVFPVAVDAATDDVRFTGGATQISDVSVHGPDSALSNDAGNMRRNDKAFAITGADIPRLHRQFNHPSAGQLLSVLQNTETLTSTQLRQLEPLVRSHACDLCARLGRNVFFESAVLLCFRS
jgi:hypothetical protein